MENIRNFVITIAGFDPSGGAGILADVKTMEQHGVYGLGVCTAITFQNENRIEKIKWLSDEEVIDQLKIISETNTVTVAKIGIVRDVKMLNTILDFLISKNKNIKIIWDPVIKSTGGFDFHSEKNDWLSCLKKTFLITPNISEAKILTGIDDEEKAAFALAKQCNVLLKGGHSSSDRSDDLLFTPEKVVVIPGEKLNRSKHGTGCVLSSAIASNLALGKNLAESCKLAKDYITQFILSDEELLGWHHTIKIKEYEHEL